MIILFSWLWYEYLLTVGTEQRLMLYQITDTVLIAIMTQVVRTSSNLLEPGEDISKFSNEEIESRIYGSKLVLVVEQMQILTIWLIKACLLIMYTRMTHVLPQRRIVIATSIYVAITFVCIAPIKDALI